MIIYNPKTGAICPKCYRRAPVVSSPPAIGNYRYRRHKCDCGYTFKSLQTVNKNAIVTKEQKTALLQRIEQLRRIIDSL